MNISAEIKGIKYKPLLCRKLDTFNFNDFENSLSKKASFLLNINKNQIALSRWVSAKRTRSYPYARVYDTLNFTGKKVTIIPVIKDEGKDGDRDFLQWDTISLMSLLGVYVIIGYYNKATRNKRYKNKITNQRFDFSFIKKEIVRLLSYQSDALHWNMMQIDRIGKIAKKALDTYDKISKSIGVKMHSKKSAKERVKEILTDTEAFMKFSREMAKKAQKREVITIQPKEMLGKGKAILTIKNYLGGYYYFTSDETKIEDNNLYLIEGKHTKTDKLPSLEDIKDGLLKMILFCNLENVKIGRKNYNSIPVLKLTTGKGFELKLKEKDELINNLKKEAKTNKFKLLINNKFLN